MSFSLIALLASLGALGGFAAGLLGFGGGVVMFPLLYYVPSLFGLTPLDAKTVAAVVSSQVFFSALVAGSAHLRSGRIHRCITLIAGIASAGGALLGAVASQWVSERISAGSFRIDDHNCRAGDDLCRCLTAAATKSSAQYLPVAKLPLAAASISAGVARSAFLERVTLLSCR